MKPALIALSVLLFSFAALAEEEGGGEHGEKKPAPKPLTGSPVAVVVELPIYNQWKKSLKPNKSHLTAWAESMNNVDGHTCWQVAVGEQRFDGLHIWRRFCVPQDGGDVLVESIETDKNADVTYTPYPKWVSECKPTDNFEGTC